MMNSFTIEVVASSVLSCINAERGGAGRIELCSALATAGITPSSGLLETVKKHISIPVYVMIRPREGDFCYDDLELEVFKREIEMLQSAGADGFVFGILDSDGKVNKRITRELVEFCKPYPVTFHRAIDCTPDILQAVEDVAECGCVRILTSGGASTGPDGIERILAMAEKANGALSIMPGGGIRPDTFHHMLHRSLSEYHLSGRLPRISESPATLFDMNWAETSEDAIRDVVTEAKMFYQAKK